jgi:hypothetical protein
MLKPEHKIGKAYSTLGDEMNSNTILVGNPQEMKLL